MNDQPSLLVDENSVPETVQVLLPLPLAGAYSYSVPADMALQEGDFVTVPLGPRELRGVVWSKEPSDSVDPAKLKPVIHQFDAPGIVSEVRAFVDWVAGYTLFPQGAVLRMVMRAGAVLDPPRLQTGFIE